MKTSQYVLIAAAFGVLAASLPAQTAISVRSGLINHLQGQAFLDGKSVEFKPTKFLSVGKGSELRTGEGLAEVLLGPGAVLRLGENSSFRMISTDLADTRLELLTGAIIVERAGEGKEDSEAIRISNGSAAIDLVKKGVYRVDFAPARLMVYDGEAKVLRDGQTLSVKKSKMLVLQGVSVAEKFDNRTGDSLFRWARRRAEYLSVANVSAARSMQQLGFASRSASGWVFNPFYGSYTYLPASGIYDSFWGYRYWGQAAYYDAFAGSRYRGWNNQGGGSGRSTGYTSVAPTSTGRSGVAAVASRPTQSSSGVGAATATRGSGQATARGR